MTNKIKTIVLALLLAASVTACKKKGGGDSGGGGGIGVPECDDYFARMDACAKKVKGGEQLTKMANMMKGPWAEDAKDPEKKKMLADTCKSATKDMAKSGQFPECDWGVAADTGSGGGDMAGSGGGDMAGSGSAPAGSGGGGMAGSGSGAGSGS